MKMKNECLEVNEYYGDKDYTTYASVQICFGIIYGLIFIAGLSGNLSVILKVIAHHRLQSARNIFLVSLMLSDLMLCFTAVPVSPVGAVTKRWVFGGILCPLIPLCQTSSVIITSYCLTAIAWDKYVHITNPTKESLPSLHCFLLVIVIWLISFICTIPLALSFQLFDGLEYLHVTEFEVAFCGYFCDEIAWTSEIYQKTFGTFIMVVQFIIPMIIITFCYARILHKVDKDMIVKNKRFCDSLSIAQQNVAIKRKRKVNYILIMMVATFIACWFPITLYNILRDYEQFPAFINKQPYLWFLIVHSIAMTTVVWNPLLFFWLTKARKRRMNTMIIEGILRAAMITWNPVVSSKRRNGLQFDFSPIARKLTSETNSR